MSSSMGWLGYCIIHTGKCVVCKILVSSKFLPRQSSQNSHQDQITEKKYYCTNRYLLPFFPLFLSQLIDPHTSIHFIKRRGLSKYRVDQVHCNSFNFLWLVHYRFYLEIFLFSLLCRKLTTWTGPRWHWVSPCFYVYQGKVGKQSLKEKQTTSPSDLCTWYVVITSWFCLNVSCMYNYQGDLCF
jgi:hypothetical protein